MLNNRRAVLLPLLVFSLSAFAPPASHAQGAKRSRAKAGAAANRPLAPRQVHALRGHEDRVTQVAFSAKGDTVVSSSVDGKIMFWNVARGVQVDSKTIVPGSRSPDHEVTDVEIGMNGLLVASSETPWASTPGVLLVWDAANDIAIRIPSGAAWSFKCCAIQPGGPLVAAGSHNGAVRVWDTRQVGARTDVPAKKDQAPPATLAELPPAPALAGKVFCLTFHPSPRSAVLAAGTEDGGITLFEATRQGVRKARVAFPVQSRPIRALAFDPNAPSERLASSGGNGVILWNWKTGEELRGIGPGNEPAPSVAFSPDGKLLAAGYGSGKIRLYDVESGEERTALEGHEGDRPVLGLTFSPDGKLLASAGADFTVRIWELFPAP